ncbi:MAG: RNA-binding protein [Chloroflexi bacterium]|nr:RNA-binding protein [Chloroflexota bacterium]
MNIYVGNLAYEVTEEELREEFAAFGEVTSVSIIKDKYSGQSKGFAFVEMPTLSQGQAAINGLNGKLLHNRALSVSGARPRTDNRSRGSYGGGRGGSYGGGSGGRPGKGGGRKRY